MPWQLSGTLATAGSGTDWRGEWAAGTYPAGAVVQLDGDLWEATQETASSPGYGAESYLGGWSVATAGSNNFGVPTAQRFTLGSAARVSGARVWLRAGEALAANRIGLVAGATWPTSGSVGASEAGTPWLASVVAPSMAVVEVTTAVDLTFEAAVDLEPGDYWLAYWNRGLETSGDGAVSGVVSAPIGVTRYGASLDSVWTTAQVRFDLYGAAGPDAWQRVYVGGTGPAGPQGPQGPQGVAGVLVLATGTPVPADTPAGTLVAYY